MTLIGIVRKGLLALARHLRKEVFLFLSKIAACPEVSDPHRTIFKFLATEHEFPSLAQNL
jgi:hypothetical protein